MALNDFSKRLIARFPLGFVATVTPDNQPAVSPKGTFLVLDGKTIAFGNIRSPGTVANLRGNPALEVNFIDQWLRKGIRIRGTAEILPRGSQEFDGLIDQWQAIWGGLAARIEHLVVIHISAATPLTTPPYDDGATEDEMIAIYQAKFAEIYP